MNKPITFTLSKQNQHPFKEWEIVKTNNHPIYGSIYNLVTNVEEKQTGTYTLTMHPLKISKYKFFAKVELFILRRCLNLK